MMLMFMVLTISISFCYGQENAELNYKCNTETDTMTVEAVYTGAGTPLTVVWSYSGDPGTTLEILVSTCQVFGSVPSGFPVASRLSYKCVTTHPSLLPNTYQLILADVQSDELKETWGVTFSPPVGVAPAAVQLPIPDDCISSVCRNCKDRVIASIVFGILGIIALAALIIGIVTNYFNNPVCLTVDVIGFVFDIISLGLSASVLADDKDSEDWIHNSAIAFVAIPSVDAVTAIVVIILVCLGVIGPGGNAKEAYQPGENCEMPVRTQ